MNKQLPIIVKFKVKPDKIELVTSELLKILEPTRKEDGCILYDLHRDLEDPTVLMFYEIWETVDHWRVHDKQEHIAKFRKAIDGAVESITFNKLELL